MTTAELNTFLADKMPGFVAVWFSKVKEGVGYVPEISAYDGEIRDKMEAAVTDMLTGGVPEDMFRIDSTIDKRILNTIILYVNAYIEHDRTDTQKYLDLFHKNVMKLSLEDGGAWDVDEDD